MHSEWYNIDQATADHLNSSSHITAVGTTSIRVLETNSDADRRFTPETRKTEIFIRPGYNFKAVDALITNFHLPESTLLMLVAAFMGYEEMKRVYRHAIEEQYRFYSFGDAMLIL
ncbi:MAG: S-adenosylmethionine:tRNA ribosyltransferase-isomerase [Balneolaceae bacterium]|nr:S-adenosylmethionine:tRNA ribosyltransferase-isomerase [Balneolaceae bacterium]